MGDHFSFVDGLLMRLHGPMGLRFLLQPLMALFFAFRDGRNDARAGRPPYLWGLFTATEAQRHDMLAGGWKSIGKVFVIAIVLDLVFQVIVFKDLRPAAALLAALILALVPYVLLRGPINRLLRRKAHGQQS